MPNLKKIFLSLTMLLGTALYAQEAPLRLQLEKPNEATVYSPWNSFGLSLGSLSPLSEPFTEQGAAFFKLGVAANFQFYPMTSMTLDADMFWPSNGMGLQVGMSQQLLPTAITPFVGASGGIRYNGSNDDLDRPFGKSFGPSGQVNAGLLFFRESMFQVRLRGGYEITGNEDYDQSWTADVSFLFATGRPGLRALDLGK